MNKSQEMQDSIIIPASDSWLTKQAVYGTMQFDQEIMKSYPESENSYSGETEYLKNIGEICNYIKATEFVDWKLYFSENSKILDLGCGGGWLSAILSRNDSVSLIYSLDSSKYFLNTLLPNVLRHMNGIPQKIITIEGLFEPLLFPDNSLDIVVASSALHHAENLDKLLKEIRRVLKKGGFLFILNETPWPSYRYLISLFSATVRIFWNLIRKRYHIKSPSISASGYLYDPKLGDIDYPIWYWQQAIKNAGFIIEKEINTGLPTVKESKGRSLMHFICKA